jgi:hypothetical protein
MLIIIKRINPHKQQLKKLQEKKLFILNFKKLTKMVKNQLSLHNLQNLTESYLKLMQFNKILLISMKLKRNIYKQISKLQLKNLVNHQLQIEIKVL